MSPRGVPTCLQLAGLIVASLTLAACQLAKPRIEGPPATQQAGSANTLPAAATIPAPVSATRAVALLDATCGAALPKFGTIDATLRASGITVTTQTNALRAANEEVSFRLQDGPGDGKTCAMTFATTDTPDTVRTAFAAFGSFKETPLGLATKYRGRPAIFIYDGPAQAIGGLQYYTVRLLSER